MSKINELFGKEIKVINMGLEAFSKDLKDQKVQIIQMNWKPPAGGNNKIISLLSKIK